MELVKHVSQDGQISFDELVAMMKMGTDWRKASRQHSREIPKLECYLTKDGSLQVNDGLTGLSVLA